MADLNDEMQHTRKNQSLGERKIADILDAAGLRYEIEYSFPDLVVGQNNTPLRFDFVVFDDADDIWFAIEYQGEQHYRYIPHFHNSPGGLRRQKFNDRQKVQYCQRNRIPLVVIPYTDDPILDLNYLIERI